MKRLLLLAGLFTTSSCITSPLVPPPPEVDFCQIRKDLDTSQKPIYSCECVDSNQKTYTVAIDDCVGYDATTAAGGSSLRDYVLEIQADLDACKRGEDN